MRPICEMLSVTVILSLLRAHKFAGREELNQETERTKHQESTTEKGPIDRARTFAEGRARRAWSAAAAASPATPAPLVGLRRWRVSGPPPAGASPQPRRRRLPGPAPSSAPSLATPIPPPNIFLPATKFLDQHQAAATTSSSSKNRKGK